MEIDHRECLEGYFAYLLENAEEASALLDDLLVTVTTFFRDNGAFAALAERVIPELFERKEGKPIRVRVAGCATGEEAYSIAILFKADAALREQLLHAHYELRSARREYAATNEALRAANGELQSINEEYRSTAEELETSKEALQSMNEEL